MNQEEMSQFNNDYYAVRNRRCGVWMLFITACLALSLCFLPAESRAQGKVVHDSLYSASLALNLIGDPAKRELTVYLPPGYDSGDEQYPVIYFLHGYLTGIKNRVWLLPSIHIDSILDSLILYEGIRPFIAVLPDGDNKFHGSFYGASPVIGDYEKYIVKEIPDYIEKIYRVMPGKQNRFLTGHSMGGFGAAYLGMKYAALYAAIGIMSGALDWSETSAGIISEYYARPTPHAWEEWMKFEWKTKVLYAMAAAFSPDPDAGPFFTKLPMRIENGGLVSDKDAWQKFMQNSPLFMIPGYLGELNGFQGIILTCGTEDYLISQSEDFHAILRHYHVRHEYHLIHGTHLTVMPESIKETVRFFDRVMKGE